MANKNLPKGTNFILLRMAVSGTTPALIDKFATSVKDVNITEKNADQLHTLANIVDVMSDNLDGIGRKYLFQVLPPELVNMHDIDHPRLKPEIY